MEHIELRERERDELLAWVLAGFTTWWGLVVVGTLLESWEGSFILLLLSIAGGAGFAYASYQLWQFHGEIKAEPEVASALNDELTRQIRLESYACAFWTLLVAAALYLVLAGLFPNLVGELLSARAMAALVVLIGVDAALLNFLLRSREAARG